MISVSELIKKLEEFPGDMPATIYESDNGISFDIREVDEACSIVYIDCIRNIEPVKEEKEPEPPSNLRYDLNDFYQDLDNIKKKHPGQKFTVLPADDQRFKALGFYIYYIGKNNREVAYWAGVRLSTLWEAHIEDIEEFKKDVEDRFKDDGIVAEGAGI